ncbi:hypothetical protein WDH52_14650 [Streptomyces sp. TRM70308]|uniref:hypothetical protein n=1 Tax=Streptomyces sp. TRM70308 TaxID=3131932 RepID=UPI003D079C23
MHRMDDAMPGPAPEQDPQAPAAATGGAAPGTHQDAGTPQEAGTPQGATTGPGAHASCAEAPRAAGDAAGGPGLADLAPAAPRPLGVGVRPTGHPEVDAALRRLAEADRLEPSAHLAVYEEAHRGLRTTLTALDQHNPGS